MKLNLFLRIFLTSLVSFLFGYINKHRCKSSGSEKIPGFYELNFGGEKVTLENYVAVEKREYKTPIRKISCFLN
jgi:hypothetical protein